MNNCFPSGIGVGNSMSNQNESTLPCYNGVVGNVKPTFYNLNGVRVQGAGKESRGPNWGTCGGGTCSPDGNYVSENYSTRTELYNCGGEIGREFHSLSADMNNQLIQIQQLDAMLFSPGRSDIERAKITKKRDDVLSSFNKNKQRVSNIYNSMRLV